jgi:hypothetical protein
LSLSLAGEGTGEVFITLQQSLSLSPLNHKAGKQAGLFVSLFLLSVAQVPFFPGCFGSKSLPCAFIIESIFSTMLS